MQDIVGQYHAVAYTNCDSFCLGKLLPVHEGVFSISFLIEDDGKNATYTWPTPAKIEAVNSDQVFMRNLEVKEANKILRFPKNGGNKKTIPGLSGQPNKKTHKSSGI